MRCPGRIRALTPLILLSLLAVAPVGATAQTKSQVDAAKSERDAAYQRLADADADLEEAITEYQDINARLEDLTYRITRTVDRIKDDESDLRDLKQLAEDLLIEAYTSGGTGILDLAMDAGSIQDVLTRQVLIERASDANLVTLDRLEALQQDLDRRKEDLKANEAEVAELSDAAEANVERLDEARQVQADAYADAKANYADVLAQYEAAERARKVAEAARKAGAAGGLPAGTIPGFICPVQGGASFINDWGFPRSGGRTHKGTDMFAPRGTPVVAVTAGTVRLSSNSLGGTTVYVVGAEATYYYAHLDGYAPGVSTGQRVSKGTVLGYVGNSGNAIGGATHLHFQIHPGGGAPVNPYPTVRAACS
jgi:murein DD-endopeptidase MepM/ murein hydrolase activator NlpD